jgi:mRNA interferase MazF
MDRNASEPFGTVIIHSGDLFWVDADESRGSSPGVAHPHVVVSDDVFNHSRISTVVVCALTSNRLGECNGTLSADRVEQILDGLRFQQASFFNR